ncbi:DUF4097 domain-containing protein [Bacillus sp. V3B]|uniref:DUF4097 family beta strand repeat-containing protein n=1 Tax=Bacillus sp. V3B TaxID=2804915 RepID=UPI00210CD604|nr:DUF4097 domain-containing protein [Bacillus sp. V3B]MCQ6275707.1 DUF4097 domain-containing protein [Bacillus sp. V3B]
MKEERKRILKMVEEGKLTVDEALSLLEELETSTKTMEEKQEQLVNELSTVVMFKEEQKEKSQGSHYNYQSAKDKIFGFVDSAIKKVKDFDLDLNFGKRIDISHIFQQKDAFVKKVDLDIANGNVRVVPWDQEDIRVECQAQVYRVETQEEAKEKFLKEVLFKVEGEHLLFSTEQKWIKLETVVYLPQVEYEYVEIRIFNGAMEGKDLAVKQYKMKTANGKITMDGIKSQKVEAETGNGAIQFNHCKIDEIDAETLNGAIVMDGELRKVELQSFNGNIQFQAINNSCEVVEVKTTTGSIDLVIPELVAVNGELKSNLGNFTVDLDGIQIVEEKSELIQKTMTFKSVKDSIQTVRLHADTKTGSIVIRKA